MKYGERRKKERVKFRVSGNPTVETAYQRSENPKRILKIIEKGVSLLEYCGVMKFGLVWFSGRRGQ